VQTGISPLLFYFREVHFFELFFETLTNLFADLRIVFRQQPTANSQQPTANSQQPTANQFSAAFMRQQI
jgi:hypothetical protein